MTKAEASGGSQAVSDRDTGGASRRSPSSQAAGCQAAADNCADGAWVTADHMWDG
jgi:hypothetical protein